ncbi:Hypothetical predicted protein [Podarcis lilfordi]|uniref:Uncharacterized protein n=1 Tax=Podarcis lilfordi TaxID=74358 RepID=A0AA35KYN2_9SAUR|nr:Hypothetical predicted protein [Podarcis lilfordi]
MLQERKGGSGARRKRQCQSADKLRCDPSASDDNDYMNLPSQRTHFADRQCLWLEALHTGCACAGQRLPVLAKDFLSVHSEKGKEKTELQGTGPLSFH